MALIMRWCLINKAVYKYMFGKGGHDDEVILLKKYPMADPG